MRAQEHSSREEPRSLHRWLLVLAIAFAVAWLATLGARRLLNPDEGRYAEIPREMVVTGDWLTPRLNDLKYFEKPPLQYWATAIAYKVFGVSEFASRLWCGLTGLAAILFTGWTGLRLFGKNSGIAAMALLGCSLMHVVLGNFNTLDSGLSFFMIGAVYSFLLAQRASIGSSQERSWMLTAWIMAALAVLSKGLEAVVLPGLTLVVYTLVEREFSAWKRLHFLAGCTAFLLIAAPWFAAMSIVNPEFPHFFFIHEHFERFLTDVHERVEPWWFFIALLIVGALPWIAVALHGLRNQWQLDRQSGETSFRPRRFLVLWVAVVLVFFSASQSKLVPYILPLMPALALLAGDTAIRMSAQTLRTHLLVISFIWLTAIAYTFLGPLPKSHNAPPELMRTVFNWGAVSFTVMCIASLGAVFLAKRADRIQPLAALGAGTFAGIIVLLFGFDHAREVASGYDLAQTIHPQHDPSKPFYSVNDFDWTLPFYLGRPVTLVGYRNEMDFGLNQEPQKGIADLDTFVRVWASDPSGTLAVIKHNIYPELVKKNIAMTEIGRNIDLIAVRKP